MAIGWIDWASKLLAQALVVLGLGALLCFAVMTMADGLLRFFFARPIDAVRDGGSWSRPLQSPAAFRWRSLNAATSPSVSSSRHRPACGANRRSGRRHPDRDRADPDDLAVRGVRESGAGDRGGHVDAAHSERSVLGRRRRSSSGSARCCKSSWLSKSSRRSSGRTPGNRRLKDRGTIWHRR